MLFVLAFLPLLMLMLMLGFLIADEYTVIGIKYVTSNHC